MTIKLLALDLDGTIVSGMTTFSPRAFNAIQQAMAAGVHVTLATGREFGSTQDFAQKLNINTPLICYQGGLIQDRHTDEILLKNAISPQLSRTVVKFARAHKMPMLMYTAEPPFVELPSALMRELFVEKMNTPFTLVNNLLTTLDEDSQTIKFLFVQTADKSAHVLRLLTDEFGDALSVLQSLDTLIEMTPPQTSKGNALTALAERLSIPIEETMAIGDQDNDASMIAAAGLGVAMGNGSARAKAAANVVAPSIAEEGAVWAIERYILEAYENATA